MAASLAACFPDHDIHDEAVTWLRPRKAHGATTHRLRDDEAPRRPMRRLAGAVLAEALDGADGTPSDLVIGVDDLELHNVDQPQVVCGTFRDAMEEEIAKRIEREQLNPQAQQDLRGAVRARCSFHLISPMVESYLFGDPQALLRAGCAPDVQPLLRSTDYEDFWSMDASWQAHCQSANTSKHAAPLLHTWWQEERHAKHYLEHLAQQAGVVYDETRGGVDAFSTLPWSEVPEAEADLPLIRALFEDLADFFGVFSPLGTGQASPHTYTGPPGPRSQQLLRNM